MGIGIQESSRKGPPPATPDGRRVVPCEAIGPGVKNRNGVLKPARCNRVKDHEGAHQLIERRDFSVVAEWK